MDPFLALVLSGMHRPENRLDFLLALDYHRTSEADRQLGERVTSHNYKSALEAEYQLNDRFGIGLEPFFTYRNFQTNGPQDTLETGMAVEVLRFRAEQRTLSGGYLIRYQETYGSPPLRAWLHTGYLGIRGQLFTKVTGYARLGLTYVNGLTDGQDSFFFPYVSLGMDWQVQERTVATLQSQVDLKQSARNQTLRQYSLRASLRHQLRHQWTVSVFSEIERAEYLKVGLADRYDLSLFFGGSVRYEMNTRATLGLHADYQNNDSNVATFRYERFQVSTTIMINI